MHAVLGYKAEVRIKDRYLLVRPKNDGTSNNILKAESHVQEDGTLVPKHVPSFPLYWCKDHFRLLSTRMGMRLSKNGSQNPARVKKRDP
ncbi:hypothetical protein MTR_7g031920 [Medicago truncatula]|uniref:Uncharacterized protein n=1 Tax=Medicago truncatula TaxID=3880 RepID=G7L4D0_MEDTR|nr:hypothetical protein MTR_7g031920 [Medicago truncatula]